MPLKIRQYGTLSELSLIWNHMYLLIIYMCLNGINVISLILRVGSLQGSSPCHIVQKWYQLLMQFLKQLGLI